MGRAIHVCKHVRVRGVQMKDGVYVPMSLLTIDLGFYNMVPASTAYQWPVGGVVFAYTSDYRSSIYDTIIYT